MREEQGAKVSPEAVRAADGLAALANIAISASA